MLRNVCREGLTDILKERVEVVCNDLFIVNFVSISYKILKEFFFVVTFIEQIVNGGPSLFIFDTYMLSFDSLYIFSSIYISLEDAIEILKDFF